MYSRYSRQEAYQQPTTYTSSTQRGVSGGDLGYGQRYVPEQTYSSSRWSKSQPSYWQRYGTAQPTRYGREWKSARSQGRLAYFPPAQTGEAQEIFERQIVDQPVVLQHRNSNEITEIVPSIERERIQEAYVPVIQIQRETVDEGETRQETVMEPIERTYRHTGAFDATRTVQDMLSRNVPPVHEDETSAQVVELQPVIRERIVRRVIEEIQPVIEREVRQTRVVRQVRPIKEVVYERPVIENVRVVQAQTPFRTQQQQPQQQQPQYQQYQQPQYQQQQQYQLKQQPVYQPQPSLKQQPLYAYQQQQPYKTTEQAPRTAQEGFLGQQTKPETAYPPESYQQPAARTNLGETSGIGQKTESVIQPEARVGRQEGWPPAEQTESSPLSYPAA